MSAGVAVAALVLAAAAVAFTWYRVHLGMDLQDESFYVLIPWRWALGDRPFVDEQNLAQISGYLTYPFIKLFELVRGGDATGLILYTRYLYLGFNLLVGASVLAALARVLRWPLALLVACVPVTVIFIAIPQLSYNTMCAGFLTIGFALGLQVVLSQRRLGWLLAAGVAHGLAVVAYPTVLFIMPFCAMFLALAMGRRAVAMVATGAFVHPPDPEGPPSGLAARRAVLAYVCGGAAVVLIAALITLSFGVQNLLRAWHFQMMVAESSMQLGGAGKAALAAQDVWRLFTARPLFLVVALVVYLVYRRWPRLGRWLLLGLPVALWSAGQQPLLDTQGFVIVYGLIAPYLFLFVPEERRQAGARLLIWVWAPAVFAGAMTAYTSASGYVNMPAGLAPAVLVSGACLAWSLAAAERPSPRREEGRWGIWASLAGLAAVVAVTVVFQFQFQERGARYAELTERLDSGPWKGLVVMPKRAERLRAFASDLQRLSKPDDKLLLFYQACGYYFYWPHKIAANTVWLSDADPMADLTQGAFSYYRREKTVPTLIAHLVDTVGLSAEDLQAGSGGFDYPTILVRPDYAFNRKPAGETVQQVLDRLPKE